MTIRVATYTRISTDEEHQPYSLEAQDQRLRAYISSQDGWELTRQFTDQMTGSSLDGPAFSEPCSRPAPTATSSSWSTASTGWPARCEV